MTEKILLILICLICVILGVTIILYHKIITGCFFKNFYIKFVFGIFGFIFSAITYLYSSYTNILLNRYNHDNFLSYPINQIKRINSNFEQIIRFDKNNLIAEEYKYNFIIDRTLSTINLCDSIIKDTLSNHFIQDIKREGLIDNNILIKYKNIIKSQFEIPDVLLCEMLLSLSQKDSNVNCTVLIYNGNTGLKDNSRVPTSSVIKGGIKDILKNYIDTLGNQNGGLIRNNSEKKSYPHWRQNRKTDVSEIFRIATTQSHFCNGKSVITILTDVESDSIKNTYGLLEQELKNYTENYPKNILQILQLKGNLKQNKDAIAKNNSLIDKYTTFIPFDKFYQPNIIDENEIKNFCSFIVQIPVKDTSQQLDFYYPLASGKFQNINASTVIFKNLPKKDSIFLFRLKCESGNKEKLVLNIGLQLNKSKQLFGDPEELEIDSITKYPLTFADNQDNINNFFLEISTPSGRIRQKILICFKECLAINVCYLLIFLNTLFFVLLYFISWFFCLKISNCRCVTNNQLLNIVAPYIVFLPFLGICILILYGVRILCVMPLFFIFWLLFVFLISLLLFFFQKHENDEERKDFKHCTIKAKGAPSNRLYLKIFNIRKKVTRKN
ncbi:hypothetical protein Palpr_2042 [Paludibacter propionicigenes WB4]|uniref:Transmembrane protein n=1 Tax=Paludibacter propionicigenes (strain DSM 17365 / JCM 13257 / WB4) TaxID=694427 RepID=E4T635_PALPW|nr:hypothetical protein [Paludibacter propionicigenes]ADQ80179.1 hypothetical protein Palpr_2042 [Paludibacter propionicigenes WB4]